MRSFLIFFSFLFLLTDCASKGKVSPLTSTSSAEVLAYFNDLGDEVCDLGTLKVEKTPFELTNYDENDEALKLDYPAGGDKKVFHQEIKYSLHCKDSLRKKQDEEGNEIEVDLLDSLFSYYKEHVFPKASREDDSWRGAFFRFVSFFQKKFLRAFEGGELFDKLKLLSEDVTLTRVSPENPVPEESEDKLAAEVERDFWVRHKFFQVGVVAGITKTKGLMTLERTATGDTKELTFRYVTQKDLQTPNCAQCKNIGNLGYTKKITEDMKITYTPSEDSDTPNLTVTVGRSDVAVMPGVAKLKYDKYFSESKKFFIKVISASAIHHFAHLTRYMILQTPAGFAGLMSQMLKSKLQDLLKFSSSRVSENEVDPFFLNLDYEDKKGKMSDIGLAMPQENRFILKDQETGKLLTLDFEIPEVSFSAVKADSFGMIARVTPPISSPWDKILGEDLREDTLSRRIRVDDGLLILDLFPWSEGNGKGTAEFLKTLKRIVGVGKSSTKTYEAIVLSRPLFYQDMLEYISRKAVGRSYTHKPLGVEFAFQKDNQFILKDLSSAGERSYPLSYSIVEEDFINQLKSFAIVFKNNSGASFKPVAERLGLDQDSSDPSKFGAYMAFDSKEGLLLYTKLWKKDESNKDIFEWNSLYLTKDTPYDGSDEYEELLGKLENYEAHIRADEWEADLHWSSEGVLLRETNKNPVEHFVYNYEVKKDSFHAENSSFLIKLAYDKDKTVRRFGAEAPDAAPDRWIRVKLEDEELSFFFNEDEHHSFHSAALAARFWIGLSKNQQYKRFLGVFLKRYTGVRSKPFALLLRLRPNDKEKEQSEKAEEVRLVFKEEGASESFECLVKSVDKDSHKVDNGVSFEVYFDCSSLEQTPSLKNKLFKTEDDLSSVVRRVKQVGEDLFLEIPEEGEGAPSRWLCLTKQTDEEDTEYEALLQFVRGKKFSRVRNLLEKSLDLIFKGTRQLNFIKKSGKTFSCTYEIVAGSRDGDGSYLLKATCPDTENFFKLEKAQRGYDWRIKKDASGELYLRRLFDYPRLSTTKITPNKETWLKFQETE